jgi:hypothetical protein
VGAQPTDTVKSLIKNNPVQTEEEKAAAADARVAKKAADDQARADAKKAELERIAAESAAAEKAAADAAAATLAEIETPVAESEQANDPLKAPANEGTEFSEASANVGTQGSAAEENTTEGSTDEEAKAAE